MSRSASKETMSDDNMYGGIVTTKNQAGEWVPVIPMPEFYGFAMRRAKCRCGRKFPSSQRYSEHYAYEHIIKGVRNFPKKE